MMTELTINGVTESWIHVPTPSIQKFWTKCSFCALRYRLQRSFLNKHTKCHYCKKEFKALESPLQGLKPGRNSDAVYFHKNLLLSNRSVLHERCPVASSRGPSFWTVCRTQNCECRYHFLKLYINKWFVCPNCKEENVAMEALASSVEGQFNREYLRIIAFTKNPHARSSGEKRKRNGNGESCNAENPGVVCSEQELVQAKNGEHAGLKFNDFNKLREVGNFEVGQTWALYDTVDGMPRLYAQIKKVAAPSLGVRITYLEPDPDDEKETQWYEEDLPVSAGKFRLGKGHTTNDCLIFSHVIHCNEESNAGHFTVFPRKGETWALFKNWDINWSLEPNSHRKYEYEFVEVLSNYADGAGVTVAYLHKAKGFASVFFRMEAGEVGISEIPPQSLYQFSHRIISFKMSGMEGKGIPRDAYELDQAALPETIEEEVVPLHLLADPKPEALAFPRNGKVFQTGQVWSYYSGDDKLPRYYGMIHQVTLIEAFEEEPVFKLHLGRFKATSFPENVIQWEDKRMPVGCGTFWVKRGSEVVTADDVSCLLVPETSMDRYEYTILPKIGEVWAIYRFWTGHKEVFDDGYCNYDIVEVLEDCLEFKVSALERVLFSNEDKGKKSFFGAAESRHPDCDDDDRSNVVFSIPKSKMLRFSHPIPASRVTKEIDGDAKELFEVESRALP